MRMEHLAGRSVLSQRGPKSCSFKGGCLNRQVHCRQLASKQPAKYSNRLAKEPAGTKGAASVEFAENADREISAGMCERINRRFALESAAFPGDQVGLGLLGQRRK